jgi:CubicO group peptidase (beta-lactamase class C family)
MSPQILTVLITFCFLVTSCSRKDDTNHQHLPEHWEYEKDITGAGWDSEKLNHLRGYIIDSANTTGMVVVHRGKIIFEYGNIKDNSYLASCRKSILAMIYGPFVTAGKINLDKSLRELDLNDVGGLLPIEEGATIRNLLTARSGVYHPASNAGDQSDMAPTRGSVKPGSFFLYNNWDFNAAGYILEKETGKNIYDIVDSILAKPLRMQDWDKAIQRKHGDSTRSLFPAYHMWFSTRDMARLGYLMLRNGTWNGKEILSKEWVKTITSPVTTYSEALKNKTNYFKFGYGYLWWTWDAHDDKDVYKEGYTASGAFGQFITVLPKLDLVVAHKTNYDDYGRSTATDVYLKMLDKLVDARNK